MTTYILAGGNDRRYEEFGSKLISHIQLQVENPRILSCFFARDESLWGEAGTTWSGWFEAQFGHPVEYQVAAVERFREQVAWADVIYFHGGNTQQLVSTMGQFPKFEDILKGKIVIGSSAGTNLLSGVFYSPSRDVVDHGMGIIDLATIVHYGASIDGDISLSKEAWQNVIRRTKDVAGDTQILLLPEGTFVIFVK